MKPTTRNLNSGMNFHPPQKMFISKLKPKANLPARLVAALGMLLIEDLRRNTCSSQRPRANTLTWAELIDRIDPDKWWCRNGPCRHPFEFSINILRIFKKQYYRKSVNILMNSRHSREILVTLHQNRCAEKYKICEHFITK